MRLKKTKTVRQLERERERLRDKAFRATLSPEDAARLAAIPSEIASIQGSHTPGPWKARSIKNDEGGIWIDCDAWRHKGRGGLLGGTLATAHANGTGDGSVGANAKLIAAAPELLAALEALVDTRNQAGGIPNPFVMEEARKAIAKAREPWVDHEWKEGSPP